MYIIIYYHSNKHCTACPRRSQKRRARVTRETITVNWICSFFISEFVENKKENKVNRWRDKRFFSPFFFLKLFKNGNAFDYRRDDDGRENNSIEHFCLSTSQVTCWMMRLNSHKKSHEIVFAFRQKKKKKTVHFSSLNLFGRLLLRKPFHAGNAFSGFIRLFVTIEASPYIWQCRYYCIRSLKIIILISSYSDPTHWTISVLVDHLINRF